MDKSTKDRIGGALLVATGLSVVVAGASYGMGSLRQMGSGFFPAVLGALMASIGAVDLVVLFDEDTPMELIRALRPDRLFKGADYTIDQVVGGDVVRANGGQVVLIDLEAGHSTTGIIRRMNLPERSVS